MIELTPLDVRKKRGDFRRAMRGFDPQEVDSFLELVAERMESLVKENMTLKERAARLQDQVREQMDREKAVQDALVTAQELRKDISGQAQREAELIKREAETEVERRLMEAEGRVEDLRHALNQVERRRRRFLKNYRQLLEREMEEVELEQGRDPLNEEPLELEFRSGSGDDPAASTEQPAEDPTGVEPSLPAPVGSIAAAVRGVPEDPGATVALPEDEVGGQEAATPSVASARPGLEESDDALGPDDVTADPAADTDLQRDTGWESMAARLRTPTTGEGGPGSDAL